MPQLLTNYQKSIKMAHEALTGGSQTVVFTAKGQASYMYKLKKFNMNSINPNWTGTHPAFIVDGVEKDHIYIGVYPAVSIDGELVSQPYVDTFKGSGVNAVGYESYGQGSNSYSLAAAACGKGFHMMTFDEWAAIALICRSNKWFPIGATAFDVDQLICYSSRSKLNGYNEKSRMVPESIPFIYAGSGTVKYRHNLKYDGISDLVGNMHCRVSGCRVINGEIQVIDPTYLKDPDKYDLSRTSDLWRGIDAYTGEYIPLTYNGSMENASYIPTTLNSVRFATTASATSIGVYYPDGAQFAVELLDYSMLSEPAVIKLQQLGILSTIKYNSPLEYTGEHNDIALRITAEGQYGGVGVYSTYAMFRGGSINEPNCGIDSYTFDFPDDLNVSSVGSRVCYYE